MEKLRENKGYVIVTSLITLVPMLAGILLWQKLPERMVTHWGAGNIPNGWSSRGFAVFGLPVFCMVCHLICAVSTALDPKRKGISGKVFKLLLLVCPVVSLLCGITIYGYALSMDINMEIFIEVFVGLVFVIAGNYLPKSRQNYTVGIKIPWTLDDEENWNRTHRLAGWIWMLCGLFLMMNAFLNIGGTWVFFVVFVVMILVPVGYSFAYYVRHRKD